MDAVALSQEGGVLVTGKFAASLPATKAKPRDYIVESQFYRSLLEPGEDWMTATQYIGAGTPTGSGAPRSSRSCTPR